MTGFVERSNTVPRMSQYRRADAGCDSPAGRFRKQRRANFLVDRLPRSARVLEIGAGTGLQTSGLLAAIDDVTAIDISRSDRVAKRPRAWCELPGDGRPCPGVSCRQLRRDPRRFDPAPPELGQVPGELLSLAETRRYHSLFQNQNLLKSADLSPEKYTGIEADGRRQSGQSMPPPRWQIARCLHNIGFTAISVRAFEFLHPGTPERLVPLVMKLEGWVSSTVLNEIAGSLLIEAQKP